MPDLNFTKTAIDALPLPATGKRETYHDAGPRAIPHLVLRVSSAGKKVFYVYRWAMGAPQKVRVGAYPDMTPDEARREAQEINARLSRGEKPEPKAVFKKALTVGDLWTFYLEQHAKRHKKTWQNDKYMWDKHMPKFEPLPADKLTRAVLRDLQAEVSVKRVEGNGYVRGGTFAANRLLKLVRNVYVFAKDQEKIDLADPTQGLRYFREDSRDRRLERDELVRFLDALQTYGQSEPVIRDFFLVSLFTGARRGNVMAMRWDQLDWEGKSWVIPMTKNGTPQRVPLEEVELVILRERAAQSKRDAEGEGNGAAESEYVFPGRGGRGHRQNVRPNWLKILAIAKIDDLRIHDLRRTLGSVMADTGASLPIIGKALNHLNLRSTMVYARVGQAPVREAKAKALAQIVNPEVEVIHLTEGERGRLRRRKTIIRQT
jgi:integrase